MHNLDNQYVRDYYNTHLQKLADDYEHDRWHSSPEREFEYRQTARALMRALGEGSHEQVLEIGPGDGVWTRLIHARAQRLHLVEQSEEMLKRAEKRLHDLQHITYERNDFLSFSSSTKYNLIVAVRCFEYFEDKAAALAHVAKLLAPGGRVVVVTKNRLLLGAQAARKKRLHSDQVSPTQMEALLKENGLTLRYAYPAVFRLKSHYTVSRALFDALHRLTVFLKSSKMLPFSTYATESYVYIAERS